MDKQTEKWMDRNMNNSRTESAHADERVDRQQDKTDELKDLLIKISKQTVIKIDRQKDCHLDSQPAAS